MKYLKSNIVSAVLLVGMVMGMTTFAFKVASDPEPVRQVVASNTK